MTPDARVPRSAGSVRGHLPNSTADAPYPHEQSRTRAPSSRHAHLGGRVRCGPQVARAAVRRVVEEITSHRGLMHQYLPITSTRAGFLTTGGGLGYAVSAAIGAALATPTRPVVALVGDGSLMYRPQTLWTAVEKRAPITRRRGRTGCPRTRHPQPRQRPARTEHGLPSLQRHHLRTAARRLHSRTGRERPHRGPSSPATSPPSGQRASAVSLRAARHARCRAVLRCRTAPSARKHTRS
ncbi:thiamine pyrophosphate-dependent enzyme [Nocardia sp. NRRL S-836]|uniref:thiamine pyrophosphate-dependent enzyme n=1 Tax=Nocardia sp. NRRL S-836 TaxID=1519492 RepID=UPI000AD295A5